MGNAQSGTLTGRPRAALRILLGLDLALLAWALWTGSTEVRDGTGSVTNGYIVSMAIALTLLVAWALGWLRMPPRVLYRARVFALAAQAAHATGHLARLYYVFWWYDDLLHFALILALCLVAREALLAWRLAGRRPRPEMVALVVLLFGIAAAGVWELFEWTTDLVFGTREQDDLHDTMLDMLDGTLASVVAALWSGYVQRRSR